MLPHTLSWPALHAKIRCFQVLSRPAFHMGNRGRPPDSACLAGKQSCGAILQFLGRNILLMSCDPPAMAGGVLEFPAALAVELIHDRPKNLYARANRTGSERIDILDVEVDHDRGSPNRLRTQGIVVRKFVAKHDLGLADFEFRMSDLAPMLDAKHLRGAESGLVKRDGFAGVAHGQIGYCPFVPLGYRLDGSAHLSTHLICPYSWLR